MAFLFYKCRTFIFLLLPFLVVSSRYTGKAHNLTKQTLKNSSSSSIQAVLVFGDSTVDPGNNNFINTIFRGDFPPYGVDYPNHIPTGRFTNGRLATDLIASYVGIKELIPAYLDPSLSFGDLVTGVSFASAGTGFDPSIAANNGLIDMSKQLQYFDEYKMRIKSMIGNRRMKELIKRSLFIVSCGTNDIIFTYGIGESSQQPPAPTYLRFVLEKTKSFIQGLKDRGAETIVVVGLPPVGCLPGIMTFHANPYEPRRCVDSLSSLAIDFNHMLLTEFNSMQASQPISMLVYADIYAPLFDQIKHPTKYGFDEVDNGCCGSGLLEISFMCNSWINTCDDRSKYIFWDSIHPTERSYSLLFESLRPILDSILEKL